MSNKEFKIKNGAVVNGQLTVNTTPSAWTGVSGAVDLAGGGIYSTASGSGVGVAANGYYAGASNWIRKTAAGMGAISVDTGEIGAWFSPTGTAGSSGAMTKYVSITSTQVYSAVSVLASGAIKSNNAADANHATVGASLFGSPGSTGGYKIGLGMNMSFDGANWRTGSDASNGGSAIVTDYGIGAMRFITAASTGTGQQTFTEAQMNALERMRIDNVGNVGIGTQGPNKYQHGGTGKVLEIYNSDTAVNSQGHVVLTSAHSGVGMSAIGAVTWALPNSSSSFKGLAYIGVTTAASSTLANPATNMFFATRSAASTDWAVGLTVSSTQNVGIGNLSPSNKLSVTDSSSSATVVLDGKSGAQAAADFVIQRSGTHQFLAGQMPFIQFNATDASYASNNAAGIGGVANELTFWRYVSGAWAKSAMFSKEGNLYVGTASNVDSRIVTSGPIYASCDANYQLSGFCGANPNDKFTTDSDKVLSHYGLTWKGFSNYTGGSQAALSGYGGIRLYTQGTLRMHVSESGHFTPGLSGSYYFGSVAMPWLGMYSYGFHASKGTPSSAGGGDNNVRGFTFGVDGDTGVFATGADWNAAGSEIQVFSDGATLTRSSPTFFIPGSDNSIMSGHPSFRWTTVYAVTGAINTSDARVKTAVTALTNDELEAAIELSNEIGTYQFLDAVATKGSAARKHIGLTVQRAIEIMESHGLTAFDYGFICYDEWDAETREVEVDGVMATEVTNPAGNRFSFRYDELNQFVIRGLNEKQKRLEARIAALEAK